MGVINRGGAIIDVSPELPATSNYGELEGLSPAYIGEDVIIRPGAIIYRGSIIRDGAFIGDNAIVRENVVIGKRVVVGAGVVVENSCLIGARTKLMTNAYVCAYTKIGEDCFIGPCVCMLNDRYMGDQSISADIRKEQREGPTLENRVHIGGNVTLLPGVRLVCDVKVGAGAVVTKDIEDAGVYFSKCVTALWQGREIGIKDSEKGEDPAEARRGP